MALDNNALIFYLFTWMTRSMSDSARKNDVSTVAVGAGIRRLEHQLNTPLFMRSGRGVVPTQGALSVTKFTLTLLAGLRR
ncbi:helix-turn-helix domain-containing protein, partial [Thioclava indica]|uniref:helix-turn-helix domain-containing protein n=1 Tax=Thioclava indica TaxID=1353528 RepID=UPI0012DD7B8B